MKHYHDCLEVREDLSAYADDELAPDEKEAIEAHLGECEACSRELEALKRVDDAYRGLDTVGAPAGFEEQVRAAAATTDPGAREGERAFRPAGWMGPAVALAAAAVVVIAGFVVLEIRQGGQMEMAATLPEEAAEESPDVVTQQVEPPAEPEARGDSTWDAFVRSGGETGAAAPEPGAGGREAETQPLNPEEVDRLRSLGYVGNADEVRKSAPQAEAPAAPVAEKPAPKEEPSEEGLSDRAEVLGSPPDEDTEEDVTRELIAGRPEEEVTEPDRLERPGDSFDVDQGQAVRRFTLRSFTVGADGVWYESGYDGEPAIVLERDSSALRELMKQYPDGDWNKMLDRPARQVFQLDGVWYDLQAAPEDE